MLSRKEIAAFERDGYVVVRGAIDRRVAGHCRRTVAARLREQGIDVADPTTWTTPAVQLPWPLTRSFTAVGESPAVAEVYDQLLGPGAWEQYAALGGAVLVRLPSRRRPTDTVWHMDGSFLRDGLPHVTLESPGRGVLCFVLLSDTGLDDAPTELLVGSHLDVPPVLEPYGSEGCSFLTAISSLPASTFERPTTFVTGRAGDVYVCHPFLVHRAHQRNRGGAPRVMAQPGFLRHRPFRLTGGRPRPIERAIRAAFADRAPGPRAATPTTRATRKTAPERAAAKDAPATTSAPTRSTGKKATGKKTAKKATSGRATATTTPTTRATPTPATARKATAKKTAKKATSGRATATTTPTTRATPTRGTARKATAKKATAKKATAKKTAKKATSGRATATKAAATKAAPRPSRARRATAGRASATTATRTTARPGKATAAKAPARKAAPTAATPRKAGRRRAR